MQFAQLLLGDRRRSVDQQVLPALRLGKGDDVSNLVDPGHHRHHAIDAERDAAMWWRAILQCIEEEAELLPLILLADSERLEYFGLYFGAMDAHRSAADFPTIEHHVVGLGKRMAWIGGEHLLVAV